MPSSSSVSLANRIEQVGRALTAEELAGFLSVSSKLIFKKSEAGASRASASVHASGLTRTLLPTG